MYSLRTITSNGYESNICLGNCYTLTKYSEMPDAEKSLFSNEIALSNQKEGTERRPDTFMEKDELAKYVSNTGHYAILRSETAGGRIDLFKGNEYYIVLCNGNTYANLTKK